MRLVVGQLLQLIERYPALVDGAFVIIAWVALKLIADYLHAKGWIEWEIPQLVELGLVVAIFAGAYVYARWKGARTPQE
jgi:predicted tellurium resistance membrane protein TerC